MKGEREIDRAAGRRLFGTDAAAYEEARPDYPERVYELLVARGALHAGVRALELGAGTGLATRRLAALGAGPIVAVEPDARLAARLQGIRGADGSELDIRIEPFEEARLPEASFDLAVAATSFHWIEQRTGLEKVARLLRPERWWAMWWTVFGDPDAPDAFQLATAPCFERASLGPAHSGAAGRPFALDVDARIGDLEAVGSFARIEYEAIPWVVELDAMQLRALYATFSTVTALEPIEQRRILDAVEGVAREQFSGCVRRRFVTAVYTALRR